MYIYIYKSLPFPPPLEEARMEESWRGGKGMRVGSYPGYL